MLTPEQWDLVGKQASKVYSDFELEIIELIATRIANVGYANTVVVNNALIAQEMGMLYQDIVSLVAKYNETSVSQVQEIFETAGVKSLKFDDSIYKEAGLTPIPLSQSKSMLQVLKSTAAKTSGNLNNLVMTTANSSQTAFYNAMNKAYLEVSTGVKSYSSAIVDAVNEVSKKGVSIEYPSGYKTGIENACRMNIVTGVNQTCGKLQEMRADEMGWDLMELTAHPGARPDHAEWQGKIVSRSGKNKKYLSLDDIGYGEPTGFKGVNCRHDWMPFYEGSTRTYTNKELKALENEKVTYGGQKMTRYEATQMQRKMERQIRQDKKDIAGLNGILTSDSKDSKLLEEAKTSLANTQAKLKQHNSILNNFVSQTGLVKDQNRLKTGFATTRAKNIVATSKNNLDLMGCKKLLEDKGLKFIDADLKDVDLKLLNDNSQRLNLLIEKYPVMKKFIAQNDTSFIFGTATRGNMMAGFRSDIDNKKFEMVLSKKYFKDYASLIETEKKAISTKHTMPFDEKYMTVYTITHEFGHALEQLLIDEYNKKHITEFTDMKTKRNDAIFKSITKARNIRNKWETKIANEISGEIYEIALKNNPGLKIGNVLSEYGKTDSFEFFAECFANMECGAPNELGNAMREYLKKRGFLK